MIRLYGSAYLNIQHQKEYIDIFNDAIKKFGVNNPVSRLSTFTHSQYYEIVEQQLALDFSSQSACLLSNGYLSGVALKNVLFDIAKQKNYSIIYDINGHPCYQPRENPDYNTELVDFSSDSILLINSINSFYGCIDETWYLSFLDGLKILAIDVSHTAHIFDHQSLLKHVKDDVEIIFFGSLGKAAAFSAGFVAGSSKIIEIIKQQAEFCAATPPSIAGAYTYMQSQQIRESLKQHLIKLIEIFEMNFDLKPNKFANYQKFPVFNIQNNNNTTYSKLLSLGYETSFMSYPYPKSEKQLRLILNAGLSKSQIEDVISILYTEKLKINTYNFNSNIDVIVEKPSNKKIQRTAISVTPFAIAKDRATYVCR